MGHFTWVSSLLILVWLFFCFSLVILIYSLYNLSFSFWGFIPSSLIYMGLDWIRLCVGVKWLLVRHDPWDTSSHQQCPNFLRLEHLFILLQNSCFSIGYMSSSDLIILIFLSSMLPLVLLPVSPSYLKRKLSWDITREGKNRRTKVNILINAKISTTYTIGDYPSA